MSSLTFKKLLFVSGFVLYGMGVGTALIGAEEEESPPAYAAVIAVVPVAGGEGAAHEEALREEHYDLSCQVADLAYQLERQGIDFRNQLRDLQGQLTAEREQLAADRYSRTLQGRAQGIGLFLIQASPLAPLLPMARFITSDQGRAMFDWLERRWPVPILIAVLSTPTMRYIIRIFGPRVGLKNIARIIQSRKFRWPTRILVWTCYLVLAKSLLSRSWRAATSNIQFVEQLQGDAIGTFTDVRDWFEEQVDYVRSISAVDVGNYAMRQLRQRGLYVLVPASVGGAAFAIIRYLSHLNELEEARMVAPGNNDAIREAMQRSLCAESGTAPAE